MKPILLLLFGMMSVGCASTQEKFSDVVMVDKPQSEAPPIAATQVAEVVSYSYQERSESVEYLGCSQAEAKASWVLVNRDHAPFAPTTFCGGWIAQAFLSRGFNVIGINRPGYGASTSDRDLGGLSSAAAIQGALVGAKEKHPEFSQIVGYWGYGAGATAVLLHSRAQKLNNQLLLGGGIYDLEKVHKATTNPELRTEIEQLVKVQGPKAYEERSPAWDFQGLPHTLSLYHGAADTEVPVSQAQSFRDSLAAQQHQVKLRIVDQASHDIAWQAHRDLIQSLLSP